MVTCPKCGYVRKPGDDDFFSGRECPKCGIIYEKFETEQPASDDGKLVVYLEKPGRDRTLVWILVVLLCTLGAYFAASGNLKKPAPAESKPTASAPPKAAQAPPRQRAAATAPAPPPAEDKIVQSPPPASHSLAIHSTAPSPKNDSTEVARAIHRLSQTLTQPMDSAYFHRNELSENDYVGLKSQPYYVKVQYILQLYRRQHAYIGNGFFVCVDMAMEVWDELAAAGIPAKLMVGNVRSDITQSDTRIRYIAAMNHAWLLVEVAPSTWIPVETTGGFIVQPSMWNFSLYNMGAMFENPGEFKDFVEHRKSMFLTCGQIGPLQSNFNQTFAGERVSGKGVEYTGRIMQKVYDCAGLVRRVTALLQPR